MFDALEQIPTLHQFHDDAKAVMLLVDLIYFYDVRMIESCDYLDLVLETSAVIHHRLCQDFYCHRLFCLVVRRLAHCREPAFPDLRAEGVFRGNARLQVIRNLHYNQKMEKGDVSSFKLQIAIQYNITQVASPQNNSLQLLNQLLLEKDLECRQLQEIIRLNKNTLFQVEEQQSQPSSFSIEGPDSLKIQKMLQQQSLKAALHIERTMVVFVGNLLSQCSQMQATYRELIQEGMKQLKKKQLKIQGYLNRLFEWNAKRKKLQFSAKAQEQLRQQAFLIEKLTMQLRAQQLRNSQLELELLDLKEAKCQKEVSLNNLADFTIARLKQALQRSQGSLTACQQGHQASKKQIKKLQSRELEVANLFIQLFQQTKKFVDPECLNKFSQVAQFYRSRVTCQKENIKDYQHLLALFQLKKQSKISSYSTIAHCKKKLS